MDADPASAPARRDLGVALEHEAETLRRLARPGEAVPGLRRAVELYDGLVRTDPEDRSFRRDLGHARLLLGAVLLEAKDPAAGRTAVEAALENARELADGDSSALARLDLALALSGLGDVHVGLMPHAVARDADGIGALAAVLPDRPMRTGEALALDAAAARRLLGDLGDTADGGAVESMTLTLRDAAADGAARFDVAIRFGGLRLVDDRPLRTTAELKGEALVAPETGRLVRLTAEGTFRFAAAPDEEGIEVTGAGSLRIERSVRAADGR